MIKKKEKTIFIIGAGANVPYGFPTASELRKDIIYNYSNKLRTINQKKIKQQDYNFSSVLQEIKKFQNNFNLSSISSVDYFIARNPRYMEYGKDSIIVNLLEYERNCNFREKSKIVNSDWYSYLYNHMISDLISPDSFHELSNCAFTFLTFNYDRSLEYFLTESLSNSFENLQTNQQLRDVLETIPIIHIYGNLAKLPIQKDDEGLNFGANIHWDDLSILRNNIKTISDSNNVKAAVANTISNANRIFFLGFGFDRKNLANIGIPESLHSGQKIFGTVVGKNQRFVDDLINYLIEFNYLLKRENGDNNPNFLSERDIVFENVDVLTLLENYL